MERYRIQMGWPGQPVLVELVPCDFPAKSCRQVTVPFFAPGADPDALDPEARAALEDLADRLVAILYPHTVTHFHRCLE